MNRVLKATVFRLVAVMMLAAALAGCNRTMPIQNVTDRQVAIPVGVDGAEAIKSAILDGGRAKGWKMVEVEPGHIVGTVAVRQHVASVDIAYDDHSYSIVYKDSQNLMYDGTRIHRNYNKWIVLLEQQIASNLPGS